MSDGQAESTTHSSKLAEQAKAKGDLSYSYWAATDKPANAEVAPKKLSEGEAALMLQDSERESSQHTASAWNSAGTFEERDVTEWAKQQLQHTLATTSSSTAAVTKVSSITGHANIWFIRGKKRHGFEFNIELSWQASSSSGSTGAKGTIKLADVSPDDLDDLHIEIKLDQAGGDTAADAAAMQAANGLKKPLEEAVASFYSEFRTK